MEKAPQFFEESEQAESGERVAEENGGLLKEAWSSSVQKAQKWLSMMAMTSMVSGAFAGEKVVRREPGTDNKPKRERIVLKVENGIGFEFGQIERAEKLCKDAGFDLDKYADDMQIHVPPEEVKNVIICLKQWHKSTTYNKKSDNTEGAVESQKAIFNILKEASEKNGVPVPCMVEGVTDEMGENSALQPPEVRKSYEEFVAVIGNPEYKIDYLVQFELDALNEAVRPAKGAVLSSETKDSIIDFCLTQILAIARKRENSQATPDVEKKRLGEFGKKMSKHINEDRIAHEFGGVALAAVEGYATSLPAENDGVNRQIMLDVAKEVGIPYSDNENFYDVLNRLSADEQSKAHAVLVRHATSHDREMAVLEHAEKNLRKRDAVALTMGANHDLTDEMDEMYKKGRLKDTAFITIDASRVHKKSGLLSQRR